jgi:hypothetical protein
LLGLGIQVVDGEWVTNSWFRDVRVWLCDVGACDATSAWRKGLKPIVQFRARDQKTQPKSARGITVCLGALGRG